MALVIKDRVKETSTTTGTGTFTLNGAGTGYQSFDAAIGSGNTTYYTIAGQNTNEWEVGIGTVGSGTLARTTILASSNAGSAVNFSSGGKDVFGTYPADKAIYKDASGVSNITSTDVVTALGYTPVTNARTLTVNGTAYDLTANRTWSVGTVTSVGITNGTGISVSGSPITSSGSITVTNTAPDQVVSLTGAGTTSITGTYPSFTITSNDAYTGTVTSVAALTLGTTGTDLSSTVANGTTTPVITLNVPTASATNRGALSSTDWSTFNGKQTAYTNLTSIGGLTNSAGWLYNNGSGTFSYSTPTKSDIGLGNVTNDVQTKAAIVPNTAPTSGQILVGNAGGTAYAPVSMSGDATLASTGAATLATVNSNVGSFTYSNITVNAKGLITAASSGTAPVTSVTGTSPIVSSGGTTPAISIPAATSSVNGYLTSTDWSTFNNKAPSVTYTTNYVPYGQGTTTPALSANLQFNGTTLTTANDASISTLTVGKGLGAVATNTAIGYQALNANTSGASNTAIGYQSLFSVTAGINRTAIGYQAGYTGIISNNTTYVGYRAGYLSGGANVTAIGSGAMAASGTGQNIVAVGYNALNANTTGTENTAVGSSVLGLNTTGSTNASLGVNSLYSNTTGASNTAVGGSALFTNVAGDFNVAVGRNALQNSTASNNTAVGYQAGQQVSTGTTNTLLGNNAGNSGTNNLTTGSNNTIIGYNAEASAASVSNEITLGNSSISSMRVPGIAATFGTDSSTISTLTVGKGGGAVASNTAIGYQTLNSNSTGVENTALGYQALKANTNSYNTAIGTYALLNNTSGTQNTAVGRNTLTANTTGSYNVVHGVNALASNVSGSSNTAVGTSALFNSGKTVTAGSFVTGVSYTIISIGTTDFTLIGAASNTVGLTFTATGAGTGTGTAASNTNNNTAIGASALTVNTTGSDNTALGYLSAQSNTTGSSLVAVGRQALNLNTTGNQNVAVGYSALSANTTSSNSTAVGYFAGVSSTSGSATFLGAYAGRYVTGAQNTIIGQSAGASGTNDLTTGSNNIIIGYNAAASSATVSNEVTIGNDSIVNTRLKGNVGVGITPSTWAGLSYNALEINSAGNAIYSGLNDVWYTDNAYYNSGWKYGTTNPSASYNQNAGTHIWRTAASGTAGSALTWSEVMRIDSSGNVGIGTSSPTAGYLVDMVGKLIIRSTNLDTNGLLLQSTTGTNAAMMRFVNTGGGYYFGVDNSTGSRGLGVGGAAYGFVMNSEGAYPLIFGTTNTERMRVFASGGVSIGNTTDPGATNLSVTGQTSIGTSAAPTAVLTLAAGTATASTGPLKFTSGTNLTTPETGAVEYDGTVITATSNTNFKRGTVPITNYTSGAGTNLSVNTETTLQNLLPSANDTITLSIGTYFVDIAFNVTRTGTSTTSATARLNLLGSGAAAGNFSGTSLSAPTAGGTTGAFSFDAVNINTSNVLTAASTTAGGVYTMTLRGMLKVTTSGTIVPQYNLSATLGVGGAGGASVKVLYFRLQQIDTQSAAAFGPAGTGWA